MSDRPRIQPQSRRVGRVEVELSPGPIARMFPAEEWEQDENSVGGAVFAGRTGEVMLNLAQDGEGVAKPHDQFNLDAKIHDPELKHPVPYLDVRVDVERDGETVLRDVSLVPVARPQRG